MARDTFVFYHSFYDAMREMNKTDIGKLTVAICEYAFNDKVTEMSGITKIAFSLIKPQLDANIRRREAGKLGGAPIGNKNAMKNNQKQPKVDLCNDTKQPNVNVNVNVNDNVNVNSLFSEKNEKIIFEFCLNLLAEGRPNSYSEAVTAYDYNEALGWVSETENKNGEVKRKKITNKLTWLNGWHRKNEQCFAPAEGAIFAEIVKHIGIERIGKDAVNDFRGIRFCEDTVTLLFARRAFDSLMAAICNETKIGESVVGILRKTYPTTNKLKCKIL